MLIILSPSKTQDFSSLGSNIVYSTPRFIQQTMHLVKALKARTAEELAELMEISKKLALLNWQRYQQFSDSFTKDNAKQAIFAFKGDVYDGLDVNNYSMEDLTYAQQNLRIISGLYGILKPLDLIQPYRLEMGIKLGVNGAKNLYDYWKTTLTQSLALELQQNPILVNLASNEYSSVIDFSQLNAKVYNISFKEKKKDEYKIIGLFAKKARGLMASYIIRNQIEHIEHIKLFQEDNYHYAEALSAERELVFVREGGDTDL